MKFFIIKLYYREILSIYIIATIFIISSILGLSNLLKYQNLQKEKEALILKIKKTSNELKKIDSIKQFKIHEPKKEKIKIESYIDIALLELKKYQIIFIKEFKINKKCEKKTNCKLYLNLYAEGYIF